MSLALFIFVIAQTAQEDTLAAVDTLTQSYSGKWAGAEGGEPATFIGVMASNDLIFVVLGVSLIIWFILLYFIIRTDRNISKLEAQLNDHPKTDHHEA